MARPQRHLLVILLGLGAAACGGDDDDPGSATTIGPEGGTAEEEGVELTVPPGALDRDETISIAVTDEAAPQGFEASSPVYRFEPDGLTFAEPVTMRIAATGEPLAVIWSLAAPAEGFEALPSTAGAGAVEAEVEHFSRGFAGRPSALEVDPDAGAGSPDAGLPPDLDAAPVCVPGTNLDGDPADACDDCDDGNNHAFPGGPEAIFCGDGADNDCDGLIDCMDIGDCENKSCGVQMTCSLGICVDSSG